MSTFPQLAQTRWWWCCAAGVRGLEARDAVAEVDAMDEAQVGELIEHPVDARDADGAALGA